MGDNRKTDTARPKTFTLYDQDVEKIEATIDRLRPKMRKEHGGLPSGAVNASLIVRLALQRLKVDAKLPKDAVALILDRDGRIKCHLMKP